MTTGKNNPLGMLRMQPALPKLSEQILDNR
jgi:hypothetical protein